MLHRDQVGGDAEGINRKEGKGMEQIKKVEEALSSKIKEAKGCGKYAAAVANSCKNALLEFAKQDEEFAQAIIEGSFVDCMKAVEKQLSGKKAVSDFDVYKICASYYFPGAEIDFEMSIRVNPYEKAKTPEIKRISLLDML